MLSKRNRLSKKLFLEVFEKGSVYRSGILMCKVLKDPKLKGLFAVSISKKEVKTAVERNKIRRRFYSAIEKDIKKNKELPLGIIFFARKNTLELDFKVLCEEVARIIAKIR
ncbi:MAG: ribonuclease P protein component [Candidatus Taylorbacteria bacterium]|nr:ribonuclease P protein component [Candidatus Taylorbacteria bacterium]